MLDVCSPKIECKYSSASGQSSFASARCRGTSAVEPDSIDPELGSRVGKQQAPTTIQQPINLFSLFHSTPFTTAAAFTALIVGPPVHLCSRAHSASPAPAGLSPIHARSAALSPSHHENKEATSPHPRHQQHLRPVPYSPPTTYWLRLHGKLAPSLLFLPTHRPRSAENTAKLSSTILQRGGITFADRVNPSPPLCVQSAERKMSNNSKDKNTRRRRSSSLMYQEPPESLEQQSDQAVLPNLNAQWVNAKGEIKFRKRTCRCEESECRAIFKSA